jgi:hypothetical protein
MSSEKRYKVIENVIYLVLWILVFTVPVISLMFRSGGDGSAFRWRDVWGIWFSILPFLVLFVLHNFLVSRFFFAKGKRWLYFLLVAVLLSVHPGISVVTKGKVPWDFNPQGPPPQEEFRHEDSPGRTPPGAPVWKIPLGGHPEDPGPRGLRPGEPIDIMAVAKFALALMVLAMNLVIKWHYRSQTMEDKVARMKEEMLRGQLQQLRHQINPHFLMNTLNNIHALVDIDPDKAKTVIIELSSLMRYVLYDTPDGIIQIDKEKSFLEKYLNIMSIRYSDKVKIISDFDLSINGPAANSGEVSQARLPSMLLVTFIENAFKHGVTYQKQSVVETSLRIKEGRIVFTCYNTKREDENPRSGGIGLENVSKRLDLIYGEDYKMDVEEDDDSYKVCLSLPMHPPAVLTHKDLF